MSEDSGERSEKATDQRMKEVRSKGKTTRSQDLGAWLGVGAAALMLPGLITLTSDAMTQQVQTFTAVIENPEPAVALAALEAGFASMPGILTPMLIVVLVTVIAVSAAQGGIRFKKFKLDATNLDLIAGTKRVFGLQALWQGVKALLKLTVIALVLWMVISSLMPLLLQSGALPLGSLLASGAAGATSLIRASIMAGLVLAVADVFVVVRRNRKHTRMTRKEVSDEHKRSDGDPLIKSQRRSRQMAMSRNRMMAGIADADVVIVNPIHFAVALKYEPGVSAPRVVAKGAGHVAGRIREEAGRTRVPLVKDVALARMLHADCEIGSEIPVQAYDQVARVLAFVMALKVRGAADAIHTIPGSSPVPEPAHSTGGTE